MSERDNLPWSGNRTWEQKTEQTEVDESTGAPEVKDPAEEKRLPSVSEMQNAQEVSPDPDKEPEETEVEVTTVEPEGSDEDDSSDEDA